MVMMMMMMMMRVHYGARECPLNLFLVLHSRIITLGVASSSRKEQIIGGFEPSPGSLVLTWNVTMLPV